MALSASAPHPEERRSTEWAYDRLRASILAGELRAGEPVSQASLAESFGVSRTPLREAMRLLQNEGLLEGEPNRRLRVAGVSIAELEQLYAMRITTECLALRAGVPVMEDASIVEIEAALAEMESALLDADLQSAEAAHRRFHMLLIHSAGVRFRQTAEVNWDHTNRYRAAYLAGATSMVAIAVEAQADHHRILEAVRDRDGAAASTALANHYSRTAEALISAAGEEHDPALLRAAVKAAGDEL